MSDTTSPVTVADRAAEWQPTACILCECNCGIEVRLGGDSRHRFERIRGDKAHPASQGYTCEKALRLDHYQNRTNRLTSPLRRRDDGTFEEIDWDTAIREVAARSSPRCATPTAASRSSTTAAAGRGTTSAARYSGATLRALGCQVPRERAVAGEDGRVLGQRQDVRRRMVRGDFEHCEVALFVGKNPWQCHGFPRARTTLKEIANDPARSIIVIDPKRSETAELADFHLQVKPGTDAFCLAALVAVIVQEGSSHAAGSPSTRPASTRSPPRSPTCRSPSTPRGAASTRS